MPGKHCKKSLPDKPGGRVKGRGKVTKIRTKKLGGGKYAHVRVVEKAGPRGGHTVMGGVMKRKSSSKSRKGR